jgi:predicted DNA-binding transcriptional regulator AlpA
VNQPKFEIELMQRLSVLPDECLIGPELLAAMLHLSHGTVVRLASSRPSQLPPRFPIGRLIRFRMGDVRAWTSQRTAADQKS